MPGKYALEHRLRKKVVIIGGGFAGLSAAKALSREPVDVVLIDRRNHHTFQPLLYQVALGVLSAGDIAHPLRTALRGAKNIQILLDEVNRIDPDLGRIAIGRGSFVQYDYLVIASGATHSCFGNESWESDAPGLKSIDNAIEIRRRIMLAFEYAERDPGITARLTAKEIEQMQADGYRPYDIYDWDPLLREVLDGLRDGRFSNGDRELFAPLVADLLHRDSYMVLADFSSYSTVQAQVGLAYADMPHWSACPC